MRSVCLAVSMWNGGWWPRQQRACIIAYLVPRYTLLVFVVCMLRVKYDDFWHFHFSLYSIPIFQIYSLIWNSRLQNTVLYSTVKPRLSFSGSLLRTRTLQIGGATIFSLTPGQDPTEYKYMVTVVRRDRTKMALSLSIRLIIIIILLIKT